MDPRLRTCVLAALFVLPGPVTSPAAAADPGALLVEDFAAGLSDRWQEKVFHGHTRYRPVQIDGRYALEAESTGAASGLFREGQYDLQRYPILEWSWKIQGVLETGDARTKAGDDYAARIYVVFPGFFFWQTRALNYIWANRLPEGTFQANAYTGRAMMIAVESGNRYAGQWRTERRNLVADYRRAFGEPPPAARAVALMTDTDDTGGHARAWYGAIRLLPAPN